MDYIYAELNDDIRDTYYTGYLPENPDEESIGVVVNIDNQTHKISADLSEATKELLATHDAAIKRHGEEIERVEGKLDAEISRAENAEAELSQALTEEIARAKATEEQLSSDLEHEAARAQAEEASLDRRLIDLKSETSLIAAELAYESETRLREDIVLTNNLTQEVQRAVAEESRIETTLRSALNTVESNLNNRIIGEELARTAADTNLANSIETVETQLTTKIESEASNCALAIEGITAQLLSESDTRMSEDDSIRGLIQEEAATARREESNLAAQIDNAVEDLQAEDAKIRASLSGELAARIQADNDISASLSTETTDRKAADTAIIERLDTAEDDIDANKTAIEKEVSDRTTAVSDVVSAYEAADLAINNKIGTVTEGKTVVDMISDAETAAKTYAKEYADDIVATEKTAREDEDSRLAGLIDDNTSAINKEIEDRAVAVKEVSDKVDVEKVSTAIATAKSEAIAAAKSETDEQVNALTEKVNKNTSDISDLDNTVSYEISRVEGLITTEATNRKSADDAINEHLGTIENTINSLETKDTELSAAIDTKLATATFNTWKDSHETDHAKTATAITTEITTAIDNEKTLREAKDSELEDKINGNTTAINNEAVVRENAVNAINAKLDVEKVSTAIETAKQEAITAAKSETDEQVSALTEKVNTEATARKNADNAIIERLEPVEAFFKTAEGETLDGALDTLKEIQDYLNGEGEAAGGIIDRIAQAETDIDNLQEEFQEEFNAETGRVKVAEDKITALEGRATTIEGRATTLEGKVATLEAKPFDTYATKTEVNTVSERAELGITNAATAQSAADSAQSEVDALEGVVGALRSEYNATKTLATTNESRITTLESAGYAKVSYVVDELAKKVSVSDYETYQDAITDSLADRYTKTETDSKFGLKTAVEKNAADISTNISNITTLTGRLDTAESDIEAVENRATAIEGRATTIEGKVSTLETESAKHAEKTYVDEELAKKVNINSLATVATTGSYTDLSNKPTINGVEISEAKTSADLKLGMVLAEGGFQAGTSASTTYGGAVGNDASATYGGAVGWSAEATTGGAVGWEATATIGGAIGASALEVNGGGAVGNGATAVWGGGAVGASASAMEGGGAIGARAKTLNGFAGGQGANSRYASDDETEIERAIAIGYDAKAQADGAVQLGTGTNTNKETLQFRDYQLLDADGKIPTDRLLAYNLYALKFFGPNDVYDAVIVDSKLAALAKSGLPDGFTLRAIISYSTDLITIKPLVLRFLELEDSANYEAASQFPVCLATGTAAETNQYSTNTILSLVFNTAANSFYVTGDFGLEAEVEKLPRAAHNYLDPADLTGEAHFKAAGTWSYISAENGMPTAHPFKLIVRGPHMATVPTADGADMIWQFWYYATVLDSVGDQYVQTFQVNTLQSEIEKLDAETLSNLDFMDIPSLGIGTKVKSEWKQVITTPNTSTLHFKLEDDDLTGITISSEYDQPLIAASYRDSTAFEVAVDPEMAGAHLYLGIDAPCDLLLSERPGEPGQMLVSAGPNATPSWSSDYVSLSSVLPYLASFAPDVNYASVTQLYKILGVETEFDGGDYDLSDTKEVGQGSEDYIDASAVFYTPGATWPSSLGTSHELEQLLKTKPCIFTSCQAANSAWKGSILVYRESIQADYGFGVQLYDLWDKYGYDSNSATWTHDSATSAGIISIATNSIVTNPIYKQSPPIFAYDSSTKILTIS